MFDGQSLFTTPSLSTCAPELVFALTNREITVTNLAVASTTYSQRSSTAASRYGAVLAATQWSAVVDLGGQSDLWADMTATDLYAAALSYWDARRTAGADAIAVCTVPTALNFVLSSTQNTQRLAYNALLLASDDIDVCVDVASDPRFDDCTDTTYFDVDQVHPNATGAAALAELVYQAVVPITP